MPPVIDEAKCIKCGVCIDICPLQVLRPSPQGGKPDVVYADECWHCNCCVLDCRQGAISLRIPANYMMLHIESSQLRRAGGQDAENR